MKTTESKFKIAGLCLAALFFVASFSCRSQHIIRFGDGTEQRVVIVYLSQDTMKYYKYGDPGKVITETMDHIAGITPYDPVKYKQDSIAAVNAKDPELRRIQRKVKTGVVLMGLGGVATGLGILTIASADRSIGDQLGVLIFGIPLTALGGLTLLIGTITTASSVSRLTLYKKEHPEISLDLRYNPKLNGVSLAFRF